MRTGFILVTLLGLSNFLNAQQKDSLLQAVTIYGLPVEKFLSGSSLQPLDSALKTRESSRHLGDVLSLQLPIYFRNYGSGMLSSISMRGTSPQHTAVLWNGININSFSLGQADFSILPSIAFDEVKVHSGAGSARFGSGAFGGTVLLNSNSTLAKPILSITQDVGSFGRYSSSLSAAWSIEKWNFKSLFYDLSSQNNFLIIKTEDQQQHAAIKQSGFLQDVEYKFSAAKVISLHYWYYDSDREIQPTIGQLNAQDTQQDKNHRLSLNYKSNSRLGLFSLNGGFVNDVIVFDGSKSSITRFITSAKHEFELKGRIKTQMGAEWNHIIGNIPEYQNGSAVEDRYDFTAAFQKQFTSRLSLALNLRQPIVSGFDAPFLPYLGADYFIVKNEKSEFKLKGSVSKNYRVPTLNDRYWQNAGDQNLLPETSYAAESGWSWKFRNVELSNTWFSQQVDEWIQWTPSENGNYRPQNVKQVLADGFDIKLTIKEKIGELIINQLINYQFTRSVTTKAPANEQYVIDKQLIYTPQQTATGYLQLTWRKYSGDFSAQYNSERFTTTDNSALYALPSFILFNASVGKSWLYHQHRADIRASVKNLFDLEYQLYADRALPGRNYNIQFTYQLKSKNK